ncbi:MAG: polysaccharide deacetylase, partial [Acidobacteria bacterium]|nr:polysaccharide deacetylase [Acidobacteriota bacterium]
VSIDNDEYIFARAYDLAADRGDEAAMEGIAASYLRYMEAVFAYYEQQSVAILGYELPQVLLLHANRLNADTLDALAGTIRSRGYRFISLEEALEDPAYRRPDTYTGPAGITWLHRWALEDGKRGEFFAGEPTVPEEIRRAAFPTGS